jgi:hypothetical protein
VRLTELVENALVARGAVRRGRHLRVRCPAPGHADTNPSCDVDLARGWFCRSCGAGGGLRYLAELLGVAPSVTPRHPVRPTHIPAPPAGLDRDAWREAWSAIVAEARRQQRRLMPYSDVGQISDWLRPRHQAINAARRAASALGDTPRAWRLLARAAQIATTTAAVEAELDEVFRHVD